MMRMNDSAWIGPSPVGFVENTNIIINEKSGDNRMPLARPEVTYRTEGVTPTTSAGVNGSDPNGTRGYVRNEDLFRMEIAMQGTILYMALFGNCLVLIVLKLRRQKLSRMQWFMVHLALADLFVGFFNIMPQLIWDITQEFHGNDFMCRSVKYFQIVAMYASSYVLIMCAVDRYMSICHPLTSQTLTPNRVHLMIALAWSLSLIFSLPQVFIFRLVERPNGWNCMAHFVEGWGLKAYVVWMFLANYAIPLLILAFCYGRICHVVWARVASKDTYSSINTSNQERSNKKFRLRISFRRMRDHSNNSTVVSRDADDQNGGLVVGGEKPRVSQRGRGVSKSKVKTIKMTLTVVICYLLCWAPFYIGNLATLFGNLNFQAPVSVAIMLLASLNSCTNPWIYLAFSGRICPRKPSRRASKSWGPSTHVTSGGEMADTSRSRASFLDMTQSQPIVPGRKDSHVGTGSDQQSSNC